MNVRAVLVAAAVGLALACAPQGTPEWESPKSDSPLRKHQVVRVSDAHLHPTETRITADGGVTWVNVATTHVAQVVFPLSIQASLTCDDVRPRWSVASETIRSMPISGGDEDLVLPCGHGSGHGALEPGEYSYEVWLYPGSRGAAALGGFGGSPETRLEGTIVVE